MPLSSTEKDQIRLTLLRELNPCFKKFQRTLKRTGTTSTANSSKP